MNSAAGAYVFFEFILGDDYSKVKTAEKICGERTNGTERDYYPKGYFIRLARNQTRHKTVVEYVGKVHYSLSPF